MVGNKSKETSEKKGKVLLENPEKAINQRSLEFVDFSNKKDEEKPCFIYDTPGIINESQVCGCFYRDWHIGGF